HNEYSGRPDERESDLVERWKVHRLHAGRGERDEFQYLSCRSSNCEEHPRYAARWREPLCGNGLFAGRKEAADYLERRQWISECWNSRSVFEKAQVDYRREVGSLEWKLFS